MDGSGNVVLCFFGDGAANNGVFHEALNMSAIFKLPVIYICENNMYAISMCSADSVACRDVGKRSCAYDIPGHIIDGSDPVEVYKTVGKADIKRKGKDITIFAYSNMVLRSLEAAEELERDGVDCEVIDPRILVPLDIDTIIDSVKKTGRLVIVSEACRRGSVASDISAQVTEKAFEYLKAPVKIVAGLDTPIPYNATLEQASIPQKADIIKTVKELL